MVRVFVRGKQGTFLVACVGADLAMLQAILLIAAPRLRKYTSISSALLLGFLPILCFLPSVSLHIFSCSSSLL